MHRKLAGKSDSCDFRRRSQENAAEVGKRLGGRVKAPSQRAQPDGALADSSGFQTVKLTPHPQDATAFGFFTLKA
jgi:hypothetical protein